MSSWYDARNDEVIDFDPIAPTLTIEDDEPVGVLFGPGGALLREVRRPFGFVCSRNPHAP